MIELTVARIAEIVGGTLVDISPRAAAELHVTGTVEFDSRAVGPGDEVRIRRVVFAVTLSAHRRHRTSPFPKRMRSVRSRIGIVSVSGHLHPGL